MSEKKMCGGRSISDGILQLESYHLENLGRFAHSRWRNKQMVFKITTCRALFKFTPEKYIPKKDKTVLGGLGELISKLRENGMDKDKIDEEISFIKNHFLMSKNIRDCYQSVSKKKQCVELYDSMVVGLKQLLRHSGYGAATH